MHLMDNRAAWIEFLEEFNVPPDQVWSIRRLVLDVLNELNEDTVLVKTGDEGPLFQEGTYAEMRRLWETARKVVEVSGIPSEPQN